MCIFNTDSELKDFMCRLWSRWKDSFGLLNSIYTLSIFSHLYTEINIVCTVRINILKTKRNLRYIRNKSVPRGELFTPRL